MTHLTYGKLLITEKGVIYKGRFLKWYHIQNYYFESNELVISYKGTIENEIAFKIDKNDMDKIDYFMRTRIK